MTGYQDDSEVLLPVTTNIMKILGHDAIEPLESKSNLIDLLNEVEGVVISRQNEVRELDLEYFEKTGLFETIPHVPEVAEK